MMLPYDPNQYPRPDENGQTSYHTPDSFSSSGGYRPPWEPAPKKRRGRGRKAARTVAGALALVVVSAAAGGGGAMWVLNNQQQPQAAAQSTVLHATSQGGGSPVEAGSVAAVAQAAADSVVEIDTKTTQRSFFSGSSLVAGSGSGVIISEDGYIVTNHHVVAGSESIVVRTTDGQEYEAALIGTDEQSDLAVVKIEATNLSPVTFADSDNIQVGDLAVAIGNPLGELGGTVTSGIISATGREVTIDGGAMTLLQTSAAINPGNSGGGLFDANGSLIGVVNAKSAGVEIEGLGFAIPSNTVQQVTRDIIDRGYVTGRAAMGIQIVDIQDSRTALMYGVSKAGVYVADPGENEGLQSGDRFVFVDGESIDAGSDLSNVLRSHEVGDTLNITVERGGKAVETQVTLREQVPEGVAQPEEIPEEPAAA